MDIKIEKKPWYIRHRYYLLGGIVFVIFLIYVISLSFGPRKLRIETDNIQIAEVKDDKFMEYVDVEGLIQPILTIKINTREAGSVERIIGEEGTMMKKGDSILVLSNPDLRRNNRPCRPNMKWTAWPKASAWIKRNIKWGLKVKPNWKFRKTNIIISCRTAPSRWKAFAMIRL